MKEDLQFSTLEDKGISIVSSLIKPRELINNQEIDSIALNIPKENNDSIMERLIKSVNMVKEVLKSNIVLRETVQNQNVQIDMQKAEIFHLQIENSDLKDKINIMEDIETSLRESLKYNSKTSYISSSKYAEEIVFLRKEKAKLENSINKLESDNNILRATQIEFNPNQVNRDFEPVKALIDTKPLYNKTKTMFNTIQNDNARKANSEQKWAFKSNGMKFRFNSEMKLKMENSVNLEPKKNLLTPMEAKSKEKLTSTQSLLNQNNPYCKIKYFNPSNSERKKRKNKH